MKCKKQLVSFLSLATLFSLGSCGKSASRTSGGINENGELEGTMNLTVFEGGYGSQYLQNVVNGFMKKHPKTKLELDPNRDRTSIRNNLLLDGSSQKYDLYFLDAADLFRLSRTPNNIGDYQETFLDITDVYDAIPEGETKAIKDKMLPEMYQYVTEESGKHYLINYAASNYGFAYQTDLVNQYATSLNNGHLPRTTDELLTFANKIKDDNASVTSAKDKVYPFVFSGKWDYWNQIYYEWWRQYQGDEEFKRFFTGKVYNPDIDREVYSPDIYKQQGRLRSFETCYQFLNYDAGLINPSSEGLDFQPAQNTLYGGTTAFMANGGWLDNEAKGVLKNPKKVSMMKIPVISSIIEKCTTIKDDATLAAVVQDIDDGKTFQQRSIAAVNEADFNRIYETRHGSFITGVGAFGCIPASAHSPVLAKEFLKYLYSDEGYALYLNAKAGCYLPIKDFDISKASEFSSELQTNDFLKANYEFTSNSTWEFNPANTTIVSQGELDGRYTAKTIELSFGTKDEKQKQTPEQMYHQAIDHFDQAAWNGVLQKAGIH